MSRDDDRVRHVEAPRDRVDDAQVGLVWDECGELGRLDPGALAGRERDRRHVRGGPAIDALAVLAEGPGPLVDSDGVGLAAVAAPDDRPDAHVLRRADDRGAGCVGEDDAGRAIGEVHPAGEALGRDDEHVARVARLHGGRRRVERVHETRAPAVHVERPGRRYAETAGELGGGGRHRRGHRAGGHQHEIDLGRRHAGRGERLAARGLGHVEDRLVSLARSAVRRCRPGS